MCYGRHRSTFGGGAKFGRYLHARLVRPSHRQAVDLFLLLLSEKHGWGAELLQVVMVDSSVAEIVIPFQQLLAFNLFVAQRADAKRAGRKGLPVYTYRSVYDQHHPRRFSVQSSKKIFSMYDCVASTITPRSGTGRVRKELGPDKQGGFHQELGPDSTVCQKSGPEHSVRQESGPECIRRVLHVLCLQGSSSAAA